jgi:flavin-dependent dehydrogenase
MYDICIIGAGIAGLYCAREIKKKMTGASICILEKFKEIGGRAYHLVTNIVRVYWDTPYVISRETS